MEKKKSTIIKGTSIESQSFYNAFKILLYKPHVINKRIWGSKTLHILFAQPSNTDWKPPAECAKLKNRQDLTNENIVSFVTQQLFLDNVTSTPDVKNLNVIEVYIVELFPKNYTKTHAYQLVCYKRDKVAQFYDITCAEYKQNLCPSFPYSLQLQEQQLIFEAICGNISDDDSKTLVWLQEQFLPQFMKWAKQGITVTHNNNFHCGSLVLVPIDRYYFKYNELKEKYGKEMVKIWPECTDPSKFVYEDVAIATYLLLLWEQERRQFPLKKLQTFVDLGCGNGLLVYILIQEGHSGIGLDVRKRKIWDVYPENTCLQEKTITPSDANLFPTVDWIIGNHSDELTPWIPVLTARSSYRCKYFLLPCCAYNFNGTKYQRYDSTKSQYMEYLEYVKTLSDQCGFITEIDRLKIPSTKRICLVGRTRKYDEQEMESINLVIQSMIQDTSETKSNETNLWTSDFKTRDSIEKVRNCTKIDTCTVNSIIKIVTCKLLEGCTFGKTWILGNTMDIKDLVPYIPQNMLKKLKLECGGLQTLLKNNHQIFEIQQGTVQLRYPKSIDEVNLKLKTNRNRNNNYTLKKKPCWFFNNHPQSCPHSDEKCTFLHIAAC